MGNKNWHYQKGMCPNCKTKKFYNLCEPRGLKCVKCGHISKSCELKYKHLVRCNGQNSFESFGGLHQCERLVKKPNKYCKQHEKNYIHWTKKEKHKKDLFTRHTMLLVLRNILLKKAAYGAAIARKIKRDPGTVQELIDELLRMELIKVIKTRKKSKYNIVKYEPTRLGSEFLSDYDRIINFQSSLKEIRGKWK